MLDADRLRIAAALKGKYKSPALHAYIDAAETEIIALRLKARPVLSAAEVRAKKAAYMREYRRRVKVRKLGLLEAA